MELLHKLKGPDRNGVVWVSGEIVMSSTTDLTERLGRVPDPLLPDLSHVEFLDASRAASSLPNAGVGRRPEDGSASWPPLGPSIVSSMSPGCTSQSPPCSEASVRPAASPSGRTAPSVRER
jgi:hypothetical protein